MLHRCARTLRRHGDVAHTFEVAAGRSVGFIRVLVIIRVLACEEAATTLPDRWEHVATHLMLTCMAGKCTGVSSCACKCVIMPLQSSTVESLCGLSIWWSARLPHACRPVLCFGVMCMAMCGYVTSCLGVAGVSIVQRKQCCNVAVHHL